MSADTNEIGLPMPRSRSGSGESTAESALLLWNEGNEEVSNENATRERRTHRNENAETGRTETETESATTRIGYRRFAVIFFQSPGAPQLLAISTVFAIGTGSVLGLIPATLADRYARILYGFDDSQSCNHYTIKPLPCQLGSDKAKAAAAWSHVALSVLLLLINPILGSWSDVHGRRPVIRLSLTLSCLPAASFCLLVHDTTMDPFWYYASYSLIGAVSYLGIVFAALADVTPGPLRAQSYGLLLAGFYGGYSLAPSIAILFSDLVAALVSLALIVTSLLMSMLWLPETLSPLSSDDAPTLPQPQSSSLEVPIHDSTSALPWLLRIWSTVSTALVRPLREISILNRGWSLRLLALASFFAAAVFAADTTLVIYYVQETLNVQKSDIAAMTLTMGLAGIVTQAVLLPYSIQLIGEHTTLLVSFFCGTLHNFLYGVARSKALIYVALVVSQCTKTNFALLSSLASKDRAVRDEQGRVQSALFATNAIANAVGPIALEFVYHCTKHSRNSWIGGPGFMFVFAAGLYALGAVIVSWIPIVSHDESDSQQPILGPIDTNEVNEPVLQAGDLTEPLLSSMTDEKRSRLDPSQNDV